MPNETKKSHSKTQFTHELKSKIVDNDAYFLYAHTYGNIGMTFTVEGEYPDCGFDSILIYADTDIEKVMKFWDSL